jgi:hypothetical protein
MGYTVPVIDTAAAASKAASAAITAQTKAIDVQVASLKVLDTVQAKTYKDGLADLNSQLDAQLKLMSAQDQANQRAATAAGLQRSLRDSQEALTKAQLDASTAVAAAQADKTLSPLARAQAELDAANSVRNAEEALAAVRQSIADNARTTAEDDRKAQIQAVKDFITAVDATVSDAGLVGGSSKTALADLEKQRKALGKPTAGSDQAIELQAVLAAEKRVRQQALSTTKQDALTAKKDQLAAEAAAQSSADSASVTADKAKLAALKTQYDAYLADQTKTTTAHVQTLLERINGPDGTGGLGGAFTAAFSQGQKAGEGFRAFITDQLVPAVQGLVDLLTKAGGMFAGDAAVLNWIAHPDITTEGVWGPDFARIIKQLFPGALPPGKAAGGLVSSGMPYLVGERGPELFVPRTNGAIEPSGSFGGQPAIIRLEIGGRPLLDYVDQNLAYRRLRRT